MIFITRPTSSIPRLLGTLTMCLGFLLIVAMPINAQIGLQAAVFPSHQLHFSYDANQYLVLRTGDSSYSVTLRTDALNQPSSFNPALNIAIYEDTNLSDALDALAIERAIPDERLTDPTNITIGDTTAQRYSIPSFSGDATLDVVAANDHVYVFTVSPALDSTTLPDAVETAQEMWDTIVGSVQFSSSLLAEIDNSDCVSDSAFVRDVTIPDGTPVAPARPFTKAWELENDGTCTWHSDYQFNLISNSDTWDLTRWSVNTPIVPYTPPNDRAQIAITLALSLTQSTEALQRATYQLADETGTAFGTRPYVEVLPLAAASPPLAPTLPVPTETVSATLGDITFDYPASWQQQTSDGALSLFSFPIANDASGGVPPTETKVDIIDRGAGTIEATLAGFTDAISTNEFTVPGGLPVAIVIVPDVRNPGQTNTVYYVEANGQLYEFLIFGNPTPVHSIVMTVEIAS